MVNLFFKTIAEENPSHGEVVWLANTSNEAFECVTIQYGWKEFDEEGDETGDYYAYTPGEPTPENCKLVIGTEDDEWEISEDLHWISCEEVSRLIPGM